MCRFETIKRIHISNELLTVDNGCLTPTLKLKRFVCPSCLYSIVTHDSPLHSKDVYNRFKTELEALYALGEPNAKSMVRL